MSGDKERIESSCNSTWLPRCREMFQALVTSKLSKGTFGSVGVTVYIKDGFIQHAETEEKLTHRGNT